jgi:Uma2 family endonuclease
MQSVALKKHLFSVDDWQRMAEIGMFAPDFHAELIEGEIFEMPPIGSFHSSHEKRLIHWFKRHADPELIISAQDPLRLGDFSEPQLDLMLLRPRDDFYATAHPTPDDVLLLIEVADTTLDNDRTVKIPLYGRYGVQESWLLNLSEHCVEVYTQPNAKGYAHRQLAYHGDRLQPVLLHRLDVPVSSILSTPT